MTHFSANGYDRHVPLEFFGAAFVPGTYHGVVAPIAATFTSLLRINRPSAAVGRVLTGSDAARRCRLKLGS